MEKDMRTLVLDYTVIFSYADRDMKDIPSNIDRRQLYDRLNNEDLLDKYYQLRDMADTMENAIIILKIGRILHK